MSEQSMIASQHVARADDIRASFKSSEPLTGFVVLPGFLEHAAAMTIVEACSLAEFAWHCMYRRPGERTIHWGFAVPDPENAYAAIQERARALPDVLRPIAEALSSSASRRVLSQMTGVDLTAATVAAESLACLSAGCFLNPHTDANGIPPNATRVVLNLAFTQNWLAEYGGLSHYRWRGARREVRVTPRFNEAILFIANNESLHWVEPVQEHAPARARFTWTLTYDQPENANLNRNNGAGRIAYA